MEPNNIKALIRKGQAFLGQEMMTEAYNTFEKVLQIDSTNSIAQQEVLKLQQKMPQQSYRMTIEEVDDAQEALKKSEKLEMPESSHIPSLVKNIIVDEPTPFDKFKPKEEKPREKLFMPSEIQHKSKNSILIQEIN